MPRYKDEKEEALKSKTFWEFVKMYDCCVFELTAKLVSISRQVFLIPSFNFVFFPLILLRWLPLASIMCVITAFLPFKLRILECFQSFYEPNSGPKLLKIIITKRTYSQNYTMSVLLLYKICFTQAAPFVLIAEIYNKHVEWNS